jgi:hypothetical protein
MMKQKMEEILLHKLSLTLKKEQKLVLSEKNLLSKTFAPNISGAGPSLCE